MAAPVADVEPFKDMEASMLEYEDLKVLIEFNKCHTKGYISSKLKAMDAVNSLIMRCTKRIQSEDRGVLVEGDEEKPVFVFKTDNGSVRTHPVCWFGDSGSTFDILFKLMCGKPATILLYPEDLDRTFGDEEKAFRVHINEDGSIHFSSPSWRYDVPKDRVGAVEISMVRLICLTTLKTSEVYMFNSQIRAALLVRRWKDVHPREIAREITAPCGYQFVRDLVRAGISVPEFMDVAGKLYGDEDVYQILKNVYKALWIPEDPSMEICLAGTSPGRVVEGVSPDFVYRLFRELVFSGPEDDGGYSLTAYRWALVRVLVNNGMFVPRGDK
jgi:hypothetical protein